MKTLALLILLAVVLFPACPAPTPGPTPTPATKLIVVYESGTATPPQLDVIVSDKLRTWLAQHQVWFRFIDRDILDKDNAPPDEIAGFLLRAAKKPIPWMMTASALNAIISEQSLPATDDQVIAILEPIVSRK
jgi:hypothetical protein